MAAILVRSSRQAAVAVTRGSRAPARALASPAPPGPDPPPCGSGCVPCKHAVQPPCRADTPPQRSARLAVCCPPPAGSRPPCPPPRGAVTYTCASPVRRQEKKWCVEVPGDGGPCGASQDRVARRLDAARALRRASYEQEAAEPPPSAAPPGPLHCLPPAAHRLHASDGREYRAACPLPTAPKCGVPNCPPEPALVPLAHEDCPLYPIGPPDPCEHQPRRVLTVDRSAPRPRATCAGSAAPCGPPCSVPRTKACGPPTPPAPPATTHCDAGIGARIMRSLSIGRGANAGKSSGPPARRLHSFAALTTGGSPEEAAGKLEAALKERESLAEAGRGRVASAGPGGRQSAPPKAGLRLPLPTGGAVHVDVSVHGGSPAADTVRAAGGAAPAGNASWLRGLQKKFGNGCPPAPAVAAPASCKSRCGCK